MGKRFVVVVAIVAALAVIFVPVFADSGSYDDGFYLESASDYVYLSDLPPEGAYSLTFYAYDANGEIQPYVFIVDVNHLWDNENECTYASTTVCPFPEFSDNVWVTFYSCFDEDDNRCIAVSALSEHHRVDVFGLAFSAYSPAGSGVPSVSATDQVLAVFTGIGSWIASSIPVIFSIFWDSASDSPTVIGAISLVVIGISFVLAIFSFIRGFLELK